MTTNIFEQASRKKLRFQTDKGLLTVEQLWGMTVSALDVLGIGVYALVENKPTMSFQKVKNKTVEGSLNELRLEIIKHIIQVKEAEAEAANLAAENRDRKNRLLALLADKQDAKMLELSEEEIRAELAKL